MTPRMKMVIPFSFGCLRIFKIDDVFKNINYLINVVMPLLLTSNNLLQLAGCSYLKGIFKITSVPFAKPSSSYKSLNIKE